MGLARGNLHFRFERINTVVENIAVVQRNGYTNGYANSIRVRVRVGVSVTTQSSYSSTYNTPDNQSISP
jgi:hypothetical protein